MSKRLRSQLIKEFPEYAELKHLLNVAEITWAKWGISASELSEMDHTLREMIELSL